MTVIGLFPDEIDKIELALLHTESIIRKSDRTPDKKLCHERVRAALAILRSYDTERFTPRDQDPSPVNGPGCQSDQLRGTDQ